ncbi:hypothetical protein COC47_28190 [Bacillus cereus]|uniref:restriction endonuclease n=1 Tax=Bacillus cereus TaxID=1396 RepID=UPI000BFB431A|nr:restriction endonuclease [Bacillus cereus]PGR32989.1 hypothetical protein COC47_28190 [Bacillus cereus]
MGLPSMYDDVHLPLLTLVDTYPINSLKEAVKVLAHFFCLTDEELNERVNCGVRKFYSQVSFSKKRLIDAGLIFKDNIDSFRTTDIAKQLLAKKPNKITNRDINELIKTRKMLKIQEEAVHQPFTNRQAEYLQKLNKIDPAYFEQISGLVLSRVHSVDFSRYVEITPQSNDGGIDGIIHLGENTGLKIYFEAKKKSLRYLVNEPLLRNFTGALVVNKGKKGFYITTTKFTSAAIRFVERLKDPDIGIDITLIDGQRLVKLIFKYKLEDEIELD